MVNIFAKPKRRGFRFGLGALLLFVGAIGGSLGWTMKEVRQERIAVTALRQMGCRVYNCYQVGSPDILERLKVWLGEQDGRDVTVVIGHGPQINDTALWQAARLNHLRSLELEKTHVTDKGLVHLRGMTQLTRIYLGRTDVTDAGMENFRGLSRLEYLDLHDTAVSDAGLGHLRELRQLQELDLYDTPVTDEGVQQLQAALPACSIIH